MKQYGDEEWDGEMKRVRKCIKPNLQRTGGGGGDAGAGRG